MQTVWTVSVFLLRMFVILDGRLVSFIFPGEFCFEREREREKLTVETKRGYFYLRRERSNVSYI